MNVARAPAASVTLAVAPSGSPRVVPTGPDDEGLDGDRGAAIAAAFEAGAGSGLLHLGAVEVGTALPPALYGDRVFFTTAAGQVLDRLTRQRAFALASREKVDEVFDLLDP